MDVLLFLLRLGTTHEPGGSIYCVGNAYVDPCQEVRILVGKCRSLSKLWLLSQGQILGGYLEASVCGDTVTQSVEDLRASVLMGLTVFRRFVCEPYPKLSKGDYIRDYLGDYYRGY